MADRARVVVSGLVAAVLLFGPLYLPLGFYEQRERDPWVTGSHGYMLVCPLRDRGGE